MAASCVNSEGRRGRDRELRPGHYIHVYSIKSRLILRVRYDSNGNPNPGGFAAVVLALRLSRGPLPSEEGTT